jgi:hypothetical protein
MTFVYILFFIVAVYLSAGVLFAIPFVTKGVAKIDEGAVGSKWGFRVIILPGTIVFWPWLLKKWLKALK